MGQNLAQPMRIAARLGHGVFNPTDQLQAFRLGTRGKEFGDVSDDLVEVEVDDFQLQLAGRFV